MRKFTILAALCALCVTAGVANAVTITVFHGTKTETVDPTKAPADAVLIIRPVVKPPVRSAAAPHRRERRHTWRRTFIAGDTLWRRDARTGRLEACFVGSSGMVGKYAIRCTGPDAFGR